MKTKLIKEWDKLRAQAHNWLRPEPETKEGYIERQFINLRHDFTHQEQNEILLALAKRLDEARLEDMEKMAREYEELQVAKLNLADSFKFA